VRLGRIKQLPCFIRGVFLSNKQTIDKFKQAFLEEAGEIFVELEAALLELNENRGDNELVGRAFRALHTIKGSGAMFGFDLVAAFVHNLESAFDEVRNGRLKVSAELINLSLEALDQIKAMLQEAVGNKAASPAVSAEILTKLRQLTAPLELGATQAAPVAATIALSGFPAAPGAAAVATRDWHIRFSPGPDLMRGGTDPLLLLRELRQLGNLRIKANMAALPLLSELDPERCYIRWDIVLTTSAAREAISDVFIFADDSCALTIEPDEPKPLAASAVIGKSVEKHNTEPVVTAISAPAGTTSEASKTKSPSYGRRATDAPDAAASIRVSSARLDQFVNLVAELVTVQARLLEIATRRDDPEVIAVAEQIEHLTSSLRENSISIRMLPIRATFERFRRLVHDLARDLHKEVELSIEGADTELDKSVIDELNDPLMHLIRNSMDHGIELPVNRVKAGKCPTARLRLSARYSGASVLISVSDDGSGIDAVAVRERAVEKGLIEAEARPSEAEIFALVMAPGFSTARQITGVSGRGVGMDVTRRRVEALRGTIDIESKAGAGTNITLRLPLLDYDFGLTPIIALPRKIASAFCGDSKAANDGPYMRRS
jgi:two-component system chemotaxis sensor kinase CheA